MLATPLSHYHLKRIIVYECQLSLLVALLRVAGCLHGDVQSQNILYTAERHIKLTKFGHTQGLPCLGHPCFRFSISFVKASAQQDPASFFD